MIKIYEVMAVENGLPLFFEQHLVRFHISINQYRSFSLKKLVSIAVQLFKPELSNINKFNLKLIYCDLTKKFSIERVESRKPNNQMYKYGGQTDIFPAERIFPLIKQENLKLKKHTEEYCKKNNLYDVLIENNLNQITEGSRSNFLLLDEMNNIITSPIGTALNGITREVIFNICRENSIPILEKNITINVLKKCKSMIITGTSPEILPISYCGEIRFSLNTPIITLIQKSFAKKKLEDYSITKEYFND